MLEQFNLKRIRAIMMFWNFVMITSYAMIFMFSTKYIIMNNISRDFLSSLNYIPTDPSIIFFKSLILYIIPQNRYMVAGSWMIILHSLQLLAAKILAKGGRINDI